MNEKMFTTIITNINDDECLLVLHLANGETVTTYCDELTLIPDSGFISCTDAMHEGTAFIPVSNIVFISI